MLSNFKSNLASDSNDIWKLLLFSLLFSFSFFPIFRHYHQCHQILTLLEVSIVTECNTGYFCHSYHPPPSWCYPPFHLHRHPCLHYENNASKNYISSSVNNMLTYLFVLSSPTFSYPYDRHYPKDTYFFQGENIFRQTVIIFQTMFLRKSLLKNDFIKYD